MSDPFVKIIRASVSPQGIPLITCHMRYWRSIHAEIMTHRVFSRNARSSRAVPITKLLKEVYDDPFIPRHWGKNQKGMQAGEEHNALVLARDTYDDCAERYSRETAWEIASQKAADAAERFSDAGYHKQIVNRLIEPFMWIDTLVTSTDWANFFALRDHPDAEPHFRDLAILTREEFLRHKGKFQLLKPGQWHLPYVTDEEYEQIHDAHGLYALEVARKISAARCARISYAPFDGNGSWDNEVDRYNKLVLNWPVHASPVEHQATPDSYFDGSWFHREEHRNFRGWRQFRALIERETVWDKDDEFMRSLIE